MAGVANPTFSSIESTILRSAGLDPKDIDYADFRRNIVVILGKSYEAIFRESLNIQLRSGGANEARVQTHNAAVLVDALKSSLLWKYPELKVVTVNALSKKDLRVVNLVMSILFQEGQRLWLENLYSSSITNDTPVPERSPRNGLSSLYDNEDDVEGDMDDFTTHDREDVSDDGDSLNEKLEEMKLVRGTLLETQSRLRKKRRRKARKIIVVEHRRNFVEENTKLTSLSSMYMPEMPNNPMVALMRLQSEMAPSYRGTVAAMLDALRTEATPKRQPPTRDAKGKHVSYSYDLRSGRRFVLSKEEVLRLDKLRRQENNGEVLNMSDLKGNTEHARMKAKPPASTCPMWPGNGTEKSATNWIERMRVLKNASIPTDDTPKEKTAASVVMYEAYNCMETCDLLLSVEHCANCQQHSLTLRHDEGEYRSRADAVIEAVIEAVVALAPAVRFGVNKFTSVRPVAKQKHDASPRKGAFEVQIAFYSDSMGLKVDILHSKLVTMRWPSSSVIVKRVHAFLAQFQLDSFDSDLLDLSDYDSSSDNDGLGINDGENGLWHVQWLYDSRPLSVESAEPGVAKPARVPVAPSVGKPSSSNASPALRQSVSKPSAPRTAANPNDSALAAPHVTVESQSQRVRETSISDTSLSPGAPLLEVHLPESASRVSPREVSADMSGGVSYDLPTQSTPRTPAMPIHRPSLLLWNTRTLCVSKISMSGLKENDASAEQTPGSYVSLSFGSHWTTRTSASRGVGGNVTWRFSEAHSEMRFSVNAVDLLQNSMVVALVDESVCSGKSIGKGQVSLAMLVHADVDVATTFTLTLKDDDCDSVGSVLITLKTMKINAELRHVRLSGSDNAKAEVLELEAINEETIEPRVDDNSAPAANSNECIYATDECIEDALEGSALSVPNSLVSMHSEVVTGVIIAPVAADAPADGNEYGDEFEDDDIAVERPPTSALGPVCDMDAMSALLEIHKALNGDNWNLRPNWKVEDPVSSWNCVVMDPLDPLRATEIRLGRKRLAGVLPKAIGCLQSLTVLFLYGNKIEGAIPEELFLLTNLKKLHLYDNALSGEISPSFASLKNLESVNLSSNRFHGKVPKQLALPLLKELVLHQNRLLGPLPLQFTRLSRLSEFTSDLIPYTDFKKVFDWIDSSHRLNWKGCSAHTAVSEKSALLSICDIYGEDLLSVTDGWTNWGSDQPLDVWRGLHLSQTGYIQSLVLRNCCMDGTIPSSISILEKLVYLDLSQNALEGSVPASFTSLTHLQYLHLDGNCLSGELNVLALIKSLRHIDMSNNSLGCEITNSLTNLAFLETLKLQNNGIQGNSDYWHLRLHLSYSSRYM